MADAIRSDYEDGVPPLFLTVMHGGMPFATQLAFALGERGLDLEFDYLHATRYRGNTSGARLAWLHRPATPLRGRRVLLADDILDEGHTLAGDQALVRRRGRGRYPHRRAGGEGATTAAWQVSNADYVGVEVPDRYVFGYGMDFQEQGRNLPAIYALKA